jgi:predicted ABC-type ATPase
VTEAKTLGESRGFLLLCYARHIPEWQASGYHVSLVFLALPSAEAAIQRVVERVAQGGHFVPEGIVRAAFSGWKDEL